MPKKGGNDSLKLKDPKKPLSPFRVFMRVCLEESRRRHPEDNETTKSIRQRCKDRWALMNSQEKKRFFQMASEDKARYKMELNLKEVVRLRGSKAGCEKIAQGLPSRKTNEDMKKPKRSCSSYIIFFKEHRKRVMAANPDFSIGDLSKEISRLWAELTPEKKAVYVEKAKEDKERYQREKEFFKKGANKSRESTASSDIVLEEDEESEDDDE